MLLAEKYLQADINERKSHERREGILEGLALGVKIIKKHKEGLSAIQIAMDCGCSLDNVESVIRNL